MSRLLRPVFLALALLTPSLTNAQPDSRLLCTVQGRVIDSVTGQPLSRATVRLVIPGDRFTASVEYRTATTDSMGRFSWHAVKPTGYRISAERSGFLHDVDNSPRQLALTPGQKVLDLVLKLTRQGLVRGRVADADGDPVLDTWVTLWRFAFLQSERHAGAFGGSCRVRADGTFVLGNVPPGRYYARATRTQRPPGDNPPRMDEAAPTFYPAADDLSAAAPIEIHPGTEINNIQIRMRREALYDIQGKVEGSFGTIRHTDLRLIPDDANLGDEGWRRRFDPDGTFEFAGVRAGKYVISAGAVTVPTPGSTERPIAVMAWQPLTVDGDADGVRVVLTKYPEISGAIHGDGFGLLAGREGRIGQIHIALAGVLSACGDGIYVNSDGTFRRSTFPGRFRVVLDNLGEDLYVRSIRFNDQDVTYQALNLPIGGGTLDVVVAAGAARLSGSIHDALGNSLGGVPVTIWAAQKPSDDFLGFSMTKETDEAGDFVFSNLPPGSYQVSAWEGIEKGMAEYPAFYRLFEPQAARISLSPGLRKTLDLIAVPAATTDTYAAKVR